jgi:hypothetical protein
MMKQTNVVVHYAPWKGTDQVSLEDSWVLVTLDYEINGHRLRDEYVTLEMDKMMTVIIQVPDYSDPAYDEFRESNIAHAEELIAALRDELTEEDWLEGTTDEVLILPVSTLELRERPLSFWANKAA